jgi:hypothetical protein
MLERQLGAALAASGCDLEAQAKERRAFREGLRVVPGG